MRKIVQDRVSRHTGDGQVVGTNVDGNEFPVVFEVSARAESLNEVLSLLHELVAGGCRNSRVQMVCFFSMIPMCMREREKETEMGKSVITYASVAFKQKKVSGQVGMTLDPRDAPTTLPE